MAFESRSMINGNLLSRFKGKNVSLFVKVDKLSNCGRSFNAKTTDDHEVTVALSEPLNTPIDGWVELIGIPTGADSIRCSEIIIFENNPEDELFDTQGHNMLVLFMNNANNREIFRLG